MKLPPRPADPARPARAPGPWRTPSPSPWHTVTRRLARHRRALAGLCAGLSTACIVAAAAPPAPETVPVVVAARPVTAGGVLTGDDVALARMPKDLAPQDPIGDPASVVGRPAVVSLSPRTPLTPSVVVSPDGLRAAPGHSLVPARLADSGVAAMVRVGDRVDVLALTSDVQTPRVVARGARIAAMPGSAPSGGGPFSGTGGDDSRGPAVLFDVDSESAGALAQAAVTTRLGIVLRG